MAKGARFLVYLLLVWAPFPIASNRPLFWLINGLIATVALALFFLGELKSNSGPQVDWRRLAFPTGVLGLWLLWMILQELFEDTPICTLHRTTLEHLHTIHGCCDVRQLTVRMPSGWPVAPWKGLVLNPSH